jgi:sugar phosphate isomerase/epimerase
VKAAAEKYGVVITDIYTGVATHRFHGLSHSDPAAGARMREWIIAAMDIALAMGVDRLGGHWDAFSVETLRDPTRHAQATQNLYAQFRELAQIAKGKGLAALYNEQMYVPSETPWTIPQAYDFLKSVNRGNTGVPVLLTIDAGHQAGRAYGAEGNDLDYAAWLREFAALAEVVHLQQTTPDASAHWPFTAEYNAQGHVRIELVLEAIEASHRCFADSPLAEFMTPVARTILVAEIIPPSIKHEDVVLAELAETARYLRQFVPEGGITLTFD